MRTSVLKVPLALFLFTAMASAQTFTYSTLASFPSSTKMGVNPVAVIVDGNGYIYGLAQSGGAHNGGTAFKVTPKGAISVIYSFGASGSDYMPVGTLIRDAAGNLYGETLDGGAFGFGTIFKLSAAGKETILHSFDSADSFPAARPSLTRDTAGNIYGYAWDSQEFGSLFKLTPKGAYSLLHTFCTISDQGTCGDGIIPVGGPIIRNGNLYGVTSAGGLFQDGVVFEVSTKGAFTGLYTFSGSPDGLSADGRLIQDASGTLYGTTYYGGAFGWGTAFKIENGVETILYSFCALTNCPDGSLPDGPLVRDAAGDLYGVTQTGGSGSGVLYEIAPSGTETVIREASAPLALGYALAIDGAGNLYGANWSGGPTGLGSIYKLTKN